MSRISEIRRRARAGFRALAGVDDVAIAQSATPPALPPSPPAEALPPRNSLDYYITAAPSPQTALDLFKGEWSSHMPDPLAGFEAGPIGLFNDPRISWALEETGGVAGRSVLELGPLEGGHSYMLERAGADEVVAIEANSRAFLKCLVVKELLELTRVKFLCGDFLEYMRAAPRRFDMVVASGVLYHMRNPAELIQLMAEASDRIFVWTHYYDGAIIKASPILAPKFPSSTPAEHAGFGHTLYRQEYQTALGWAGFCGGSAEHSTWMSRDDLFACVRHFGFGDIRVAFDAPDHPNGPSLAFVATRQ